MLIEQVVRRFGAGRLSAEPQPVPGGLSNEMWRVVTDRGVFAVKRMVVNAGNPGFVAAVEASFQVEQRAAAAGVAMPRPLPCAGRALAEVAGSLFRMHEWVDGRPGAGPATAAARLLAHIHTVGRPRLAPAPDTAWAGDRWGADVAALTRRVRSGPPRMAVVDSHRDLDRKNTLLGSGGRLLALDWDAAGPASAAHEAAGLALDWSGGDPAVLSEVLRAYGEHGGVDVPAQPWVFAGWVAALGGWLDYNADHRADTPVGRAEVTATLARLRHLAATLDALC